MAGSLHENLNIACNFSRKFVFSLAVCCLYCLASRFPLETNQAFSLATFSLLSTSFLTIPFQLCHSFRLLEIFEGQCGYSNYEWGMWDFLYREFVFNFVDW